MGIVGIARMQSNTPPTNWVSIVTGWVVLSYGHVKGWILVHWTISSRYEKYHRDILLKNLVDEKVAVLIVEFLLDLYMSETSKGDSWCLGSLERKTRTTPQSALLHRRALFFYRGGVGWVKLEILKFCYSISACLSPNRWTMNANQTNYPYFWKDCTNGLCIELVCAFLCCHVLLKHNFIKIGMLI